ncbi:dihydrodipicolinate synthase family protein [Dactylosporangium sp. CA-139114]|uniref:dihydrodipicolinate synthase family protein n=1 Tax=Dactylosporangium sp. CA-139114 TaxID=3239931 RepID=UPI003D95812C
MPEVVPPLITPLTAAGAPDLPSLDRLVRHVVAEGADGVLVLGSTGEGGHLLPAEQEAVVATAAATGHEVMAGVPALNTRQAAQLAARFAAAGAHTLLVPPPSMFPLAPAELAAHFATVAEAGGRPVIAYHVPSRVPSPVGPALLADLVAKGVLAGVKDSSGDLGGHRAAVLAVGRDTPGVRLLTGSETCVDAALQLGFTGAVPGLANVFTALHRALADAAGRGEWAEARRRQDRLAYLHRIYEGPHGEASFTAGAIGALKTALVELGVIETATLSAPFVQVGAEAAGHVRAVLREAREEPR